MNKAIKEKCRLLIIGDSEVGKTSFLSCYSKGEFNLTYLATTGFEFSTKDDIIDDKLVRVELWDTSGTEKFHSLTANFFNRAEGIMVMFDVTNITSYENVRNWTESIKIHISSEINNIPVIIIGNKIDIKQREIKTEEAKKFCQELGYKYFETSAKTGENVNHTIKYLAKEVLRINKINKNNTISSNTGGGNRKNSDGKYSHHKNGCCCLIM